MKQKHKYYNRYTAGTLVVLLIAIGVVVVLKHNTTEAASSPKTQSVASQFSFTGVTDWRQGPSNETSMALFYNPYDCFTSVEHKTGVVDVAVELQKSQDDLANGGYTSTPSATVTATLQTKAGQQQYDLHQYAVTGSGSAGKVYGAHEFGYLQLGSGYVKVEGYCDTSEHLPATIPALQAIKFDAS